MPEWLHTFINTYLVGFVIDLVVAIAVLLVGFALAKYLIKGLRKLRAFKNLDSNVQSFLLNFAGATVRVLAILTAVVILGVPEASVVAAIGSCGVAIGLALQGGLSNIAGGIIIMICRPFHVGDYIEAASVSGVVKDIGIYYTKMVTADNKDVAVPNSVLSGSTVTNYSTQAYRRIDFDFSISYDSDIDLARKVLLATASMNDLIEKDPAPEVYVAAHGESAVTIKLRVWCAASNYWTVNFDMWEDVKKAFDKFGIEIPYNHLNVIVDTKE